MFTEYVAYQLGLTTHEGYASRAAQKGPKKIVKQATRLVDTVTIGLVAAGSALALTRLNWQKAIDYLKLNKGVEVISTRSAQLLSRFPKLEGGLKIVQEGTHKLGDLYFAGVPHKKLLRGTVLGLTSAALASKARPVEKPVTDRTTPLVRQTSLKGAVSELIYRPVC